MPPGQPHSSGLLHCSHVTRLYVHDTTEILMNDVTLGPVSLVTANWLDTSRPSCQPPRPTQPGHPSNGTCNVLWQWSWPLKVKGHKVRTPAIALLTWVRLKNSSTLQSPELAADWHELMIPQRIMWSSIALLTDNCTRGAASRHTTAPISHVRPSPRSSHQVSYYWFPIPLRAGGWVGLSTQ